MKHKARKRFGQNFLHDQHLIDRIVSAINPVATDTLIEVGPGLGALTMPLLEQLEHLHVIEIDRDLVKKLYDKQIDRLSIHEQDVLTTDWQTFGSTELRIVGNLPYNIGTPLLLNLIQYRQLIKDVHAMLQLEVVDRLSADVGTRAYGRLSVMMQSCFKIHKLFDVPPTAFNPEPKVQSAVVRLQPISNLPSDSVIDKLAETTRAAFANKRKTLKNNLKGIIDSDTLTALGIDPVQRAETLTIDQFQRLSEVLP